MSSDASKKGSAVQLIFFTQLFESYFADDLSAAARGPRMHKVHSSEHSPQLTPCQWCLSGHCQYCQNSLPASGISIFSSFHIHWMWRGGGGEDTEHLTSYHLILGDLAWQLRNSCVAKTGRWYKKNQFCALYNVVLFIMKLDLELEVQLPQEAMQHVCFSTHKLAIFSRIRCVFLTR